MKKTNIAMRILLLISIIFLASCMSKANTKSYRTLADIDNTRDKKQQSQAAIPPKTEAEIRQAYADYLKNSTKNDKARSTVINRLAEMEFELSNKLLEESKSLQQGTNDELDEELYNQRLNKTIELLQMSLQDYPESKNNDKLLYQLAKAHDQIGNSEKSFSILRNLTDQYPDSKYAIEAHFRIAERSFSQGDYVNAEDAYTQVIGAPKSEVFYEKSLFKRGWSRFKQQFYFEAVDDFLDAANYHEFDEIDKLDKNEKDQFNEYFRAIGLAFSYLGGPEPLRNYFANNPDFKYIYHTYSMVSDIYFKQERYTDAVDTMQHYIKQHPNSKKNPYAYLKIIKIWQASNFKNRLYAAIDTYYQSYNPDSVYWKKNSNNTAYKKTTRSLREYITLMATYFHNQYQKNNKLSSYKNAETWYQRYLKHYKPYVRQDKIYFLYAELLLQAKQYKNALQYYELAAYDGKIILDKEAAYATVFITNQLLSQRKTNKKQWLDKHIEYALRFSQEYKDDKRSTNTVTHAAELAYQAKQYQRAIDLTSINNNSANNQLIRAKSYFKLAQYKFSETNYADILFGKKINQKQRKNAINGQALSIYKQAEKSKVDGNLKEARQHFIRIVDAVPESDIAATGLYDGIALSMQEKDWSGAIQLMQKFQQHYPRHKYSNDVNKKLSVAYLNSGQQIKAAQQFEKISNEESNQDIKKAALWQAAELYEEKDNIELAIKTYSDYAKNYQKPFSNHMEAMYKIISLYTKDSKEKNNWLNNIINIDQKTYQKEKTERTKFIASKASLALAKQKQIEFEKYKLVNPLKSNLRKKKKAMQQSVKLYGQASIYKNADVTTEATYSIASIYKHFSQSLLESERPKNLDADSLEQYEILLEDQAYPFEDKAIEFFETNITRIKDDIYNSWVEKSLNELKTLFPARYNKKPKIDPYIGDTY